jgi:hypothetical protein
VRVRVHSGEQRLTLHTLGLTFGGAEGTSDEVELTTGKAEVTAGKLGMALGTFDFTFVMLDLTIGEVVFNVANPKCFQR